MAFYSGSVYERYMIINRSFGPYAWVYWGVVLCNIAIPQLLWSQRVKRNVLLLWLISMFVNVGMWLERFMIVVVSLHRDFVPSSWGMYYPTFWDYATFFGTIGFFVMLLFLFIRFLPMISIFEMRHLVAKVEGSAE